MAGKQSAEFVLATQMACMGLHTEWMDARGRGCSAAVSLRWVQPRAAPPVLCSAPGSGFSLATKDCLLTAPASCCYSPGNTFK